MVDGACLLSRPQFLVAGASPERQDPPRPEPRHISATLKTEKLQPLGPALRTPVLLTASWLYPVAPSPLPEPVPQFYGTACAHVGTCEYDEPAQRPLRAGS